MKTEIYIGTVLLERNRWAPGKQPTYRVSEWVERFEQAGFDGMELWENHAARACAKELGALRRSALPVAVFNSYASFDDRGDAERREVARLASLLGARSVKFNLGRDMTQRDIYARHALEWQRQLPPGTRLLCECHGGTVMEDPEVAEHVFAAWGGEAFQAIIHPFSTEIRILRQWFEHLGPRITHTHVQLRGPSGELKRLDSEPRLVRETLRIMYEEGFKGSFTLEFAEGTNTPGESIEALFESAVADLTFLRGCLA